jgi:hypothetical protein
MRASNQAVKKREKQNKKPSPTHTQKRKGTWRKKKTG